MIWINDVEAPRTVRLAAGFFTCGRQFRLPESSFRAACAAATMFVSDGSDSVGTSRIGMHLGHRLDDVRPASDRVLLNGKRRARD